MRLPRPIKNSLLPLLLLFAAQKVCAQLLPADDFFNGGAQLYISNNIPAALERTESGLKIYPDDEKLKKLEELLKQQQQSQNSQSQQNQQQQQSQSKQNSNSQNQQQNQQQSQQNSQGQKKDEQQKQPEQQKSDGEKRWPKETKMAKTSRLAGTDDAGGGEAFAGRAKGQRADSAAKAAGQTGRSETGQLKDW